LSNGSVLESQVAVSVVDTVHGGVARNISMRNGAAGRGDNRLGGCCNGGLAGTRVVGAETAEARAMIPASRARLCRGTDALLLFSHELSRRSKHTPTMVGDVGNAPHDMEARSSDRGLNFCVFDQLCIGNRGLQEDMRENGLHVCVGAFESRIFAGEDRGFVHCIPKLLKPELRGVRCPYILSSRRVPRPLSQHMPCGARPIPDGMGDIPAVSFLTAIAFYPTHCRYIVRHA
jgi:hypothetical protein